MVNWRVKGNYTSRQETIIWESLNLTRNKAEGLTTGQVRNRMSMKDSLREVSETEEVLSGGLMARGMKVISRTACNVVTECFSGKAETSNMRATGKMECLTARGFNTSTTVSDMREVLRRISSTETVSFTRTTRLFTGFGKITSCR